MGNFSIQGQKYRHLPSGSECVIMADFPDRHRVRIKLDNGREMDEVAYHDMAPLVEPAPPPSPQAHPEADPAEDQVEGYPFRGRSEWNRSTRRERRSE